MKRLDTFNRLSNLSFKDGLPKIEKLRLMADVLWERIKYGTEIQDYFQYEFFKLKNRERRNYMTLTKLRYIMRMCNDPSKRIIFDDKALFNQTFSDYLYRDWLDLTVASYQEFEDFIRKHPLFFVKARMGMFGKHAGKYVAGEHGGTAGIQVLYKDLQEKGCLVEELISQHPLLENFNNSSVNTLRIVTLLSSEKKLKIMSAVLRIGRAGKTVDNFHYFGIAATVDVDTGIVNSPGIDREFKRYIVHPDSKEQIIGFRIPSWDKAVDLISRAALEVPEVRYIGWDVAIDSNGKAQLIEGNYGADPDITQIPCRVGKWPEFEKEIKK